MLHIFRIIQVKLWARWKTLHRPACGSKFHDIERSSRQKLGRLSRECAINHVSMSEGRACKFGCRAPQNHRCICEAVGNITSYCCFLSECFAPETLYSARRASERETFESESSEWAGWWSVSRCAAGERETRRAPYVCACLEPIMSFVWPPSHGLETTVTRWSAHNNQHHRRLLLLCTKLIRLVSKNTLLNILEFEIYNYYH